VAKHHIPFYHYIVFKQIWSGRRPLVDSFVKVDVKFLVSCCSWLTVHPILKKQVLGRSYILGTWVLVLLGLLQPGVPVFGQNFARTVEITMLWPELPNYWKLYIFNHTNL
jgi:hypothetical protein